MYTLQVRIFNLWTSFTVCNNYIPRLHSPDDNLKPWITTKTKSKPGGKLFLQIKTFSVLTYKKIKFLIFKNDKKDISKKINVRLKGSKSPNSNGK